jgi:hypothetical protein
MDCHSIFNALGHVHEANNMTLIINVLRITKHSPCPLSLTLIYFLDTLHYNVGTARLHTHKHTHTQGGNKYCIYFNATPGFFLNLVLKYVRLSYIRVLSAEQDCATTDLSEPDHAKRNQGLHRQIIICRQKENTG